MIATYHNHTVWSDGKATVEATVAHAADLGVDELGISDHFVLHPEGQLKKWAMHPDHLADYVESVLSSAPTEGAGPRVRLGLEVDWFPGHADAIRAALAPFPFDYLIGSVHEVGGAEVDGSPRSWSALSPAEQTERHRLYWMHMRSLAESGVFDIAAHIDLPKKFGQRPADEMDAIGGEIDAALDALAAADMVVELNTSGWHKAAADGYPSSTLLEKCCARGIAVTISADAHDPAHLLRDFARAAARLERAGYTEIARFSGRSRSLEPLASSVPVSPAG